MRRAIRFHYAYAKKAPWRVRGKRVAKDSVRCSHSDAASAQRRSAQRAPALPALCATMRFEARSAKDLCARTPLR